MATTQEKRLMQVATPLEYDFLLINRINAEEGISRLFSFELELLHAEEEEGKEATPVDAGKLLGRAMTVSIKQEDGTGRFFSGVVRRFAQGSRDRRFSFYQATLVPHVWILTQSRQSRIFQNRSVPEILKDMLEGFNVTYEIQGVFKPRNHCVQYDETDFDFISRLMEEEGIYYFFEHNDTEHRMIVANTPQSHPDCPSRHELPYIVERPDEEGFVPAIQTWETAHNLQSGKVTLWDYHFQTPANNLDATQPSQFDAGDNQKLEIYRFPAGYARKYDDIDRSGGERSDVQNVFDERSRQAEMMMESLDAGYRETSAFANCSSVTAGYKFELSNHPDAGDHLITSVVHTALQSPDYISDGAVDDAYTNTFTCIPHGKNSPSFRPLRLTPKPVVRGGQTALVVGPSGEEIFTDKFGRVKVQFHWDREGQADPGSSCWLRVAQPWAGNRWGMVFIPRIGMEVIVHFMEGDPDQPIITGCVYNPAAMPPYTLPEEKTKSTIKTYSSKGGGGFNEVRFEDKKGEEQIFVHGEKNLDIRIKEDAMELIGQDRHLYIDQEQREKVKKDKHLQVGGDRTEKVDGSVSLKIGSDRAEKVGQKYAVDAGREVHIKAGMNLVLESGTTLTLKVGGNFININAGGIFIKGTMVMLNSGGAAGSGAGAKPDKPRDPLEADTADPGQRTKPAPRQKPPERPEFNGPAAQVLVNAAQNGTPFCEIC